MITIALNWEWFILTCFIIGVSRLLFLRFLPFKLISITTAATVGFGAFLVLPILGYSNLFAISLRDYSLYVCLAYFSFLTGASLARRLFVGRESPKIKFTPGADQTTFAAIFCVLWLAILLGEFFLKCGFVHMWDVIFGGWAHIQLLTQIGELMQSNQGFSYLDAGKILLDDMFCCFWVILYMKVPKRALVIWTVFIITNLGDYISRSSLLELVLVPFFAYVLLNRPSAKKLTVLSGILLLISLIFFSWDSSIRLGLNPSVTADKVFSDTMRDAGDSAVPATVILARNIRGQPSTYIIGLATFLIPRSIWNNKPNLQYNYDMTYLLTGMLIGQGTSVITSTMLGEAWYYFGWSGTIWLMLVFGFFAYFFESFLGNNIYFLGLFFEIFYLTIIEVRSEFIAYYQSGIAALVAAMVVKVIVELLSARRKELHGPANLKSIKAKTGLLIKKSSINDPGE